MAERKPIFIAAEGFAEEMAQSDTATFGGLTLGGDIAMGGNKVTNVGDATADGDAIGYQQTGAELGDLTITSGGDITVSGGGELVGLPGTPSGATAATSKAYVDGLVQGLDIHDSVRAATTGPLTLASDFENGDTIDGVTLATGNRILIKNQASGVENGIYVVNATGAPTRAADWPLSYEAASAFTFVEEGTANADSGWTCTNDQASDTTGTHALTFAQFSGAGQITAGAGLTKSGNTLDVGAGNGISVAADTVAVNPDTTSTTTTEANAIVVGVNGVSVKVDDSSIEGSLQGSAGAESLRVKAGGITGTMLDPNINITTTGNITTTAGIFTGDGSGLTNLPSAASTDSVTVTALKSTAGTINKGQPVYLISDNGTDHLVELADADNAAASPAFGIAATTITDAAAGTVVLLGELDGVDTSTFTLGDYLYVSTTPGVLTATRPTGATTSVQPIAVVTTVNATTGRLEVIHPHVDHNLPNIAQNNFWVGDASAYPQATAFGNGLSVTPGTSLVVNITPDIGLHFNGTALEIELDNTPDTLDADASGLKVVGLPSLFKINDTAVGATVTAPNLDSLTDGSNADSLHVHAAAPATEAPKIENTLTTATDTTANGDPVYINGANTIGKADAGVDAKSRVIGVIRTGAGAAGATPEVVSHGLCTGVLAGATANTPYYLQDTGGIGTALPASGKRIILVGWAYNTTDLWVNLIDYGKKAA